ncbi:hypothetical protein [Sphingobium sp. CFD-2]|uniref:hypothetical protein n=1 Tax=Sphingobium sp. CFD-2 TaxID=2878542 RepID=UPI00214B248B|nr:hypothetical protein [Sphingobium sp. CFD-2]
MTIIAAAALLAVFWAIQMVLADVIGAFPAMVAMMVFGVILRAIVRRFAPR